MLNDNSIILGIAHDNPDTTKPEDCRYDTCIVVSDDYCVNEGDINQGNIIRGNYAVFKINHTAEAVQKAWIEIFPELLRQGYKFDETRPILERYRVEMVNNHYCEICVPIHWNIIRLLPICNAFDNWRVILISNKVANFIGAIDPVEGSEGGAY